MKIHQIVNEATFPKWIDDALGKIGIKTTSAIERKAAEAMAQRLEKLEPFINNVSNKYADKVFNLRKSGIDKEPDFEQFIKQYDTRWHVRTLKEKEAIYNEVKRRSDEIIDAKIASGKPQQQTQQQPPKQQQNTKQKQKEPEEPKKVEPFMAKGTLDLLARKKLGDIELRGFIERSLGTISYVVFLVGGYKTIEEGVRQYETYYEMSLLPPNDPKHITQEQLLGFKRQVIEQGVLKLAGQWALFRAGRKVGAIVGGVGSILTYAVSLGTLSGRFAGIAGRLAGEVAGTVLAKYLEKDKDMQDLLAWTVWSAIDPAVVKIADWAKYEGVIGRLLEDIEKEKASNGQQVQTTGGTQSEPATQSGQPQSNQQTPSSQTPAATPSGNAPASGNNQVKPDHTPAEYDDAWNRLLQMK